MPQASKDIAQHLSPPVHQHRTWRHLQRAAVAAHPALNAVTQASFCSLMVPAASVAVWILQHAPRLAARAELHILVANAIEFEALDRGRWFQFIPWLLGRPGLKIRVTLQGSSLSRSLAEAAGAPGDAMPTEDAIERHLRTRAWTAVNPARPADIFTGTLKALTTQIAEGGRHAPDLCVLFAPAFAQPLDTLLSEEGVLPLLRRDVPLALFSTSEAEQLIDLYALEAHGLQPSERDCWPNPWALPTENAERRVVYGKFGWEARFEAVPDTVSPDPFALDELTAALGYVGKGLADLEAPDGPDALLNLGELLGTAPRDSSRDAALDPNTEGAAGGALLRLPKGVAVDLANGAVYQLQDTTALLLEAVPQLPAAVLASVPDDDDTLRRVMWAVRAHREYVSPFVDDVDNALRSQFATLDRASQGAAAAPCI
jgi:hypothetical protein